MNTQQAEIDRLIEQFDPESTFRRLAGVSAGIVAVIAVGLSGWHYYTAGFGLHNEIAHRAIHLAVVLGLCFLVFPRQHRLPGPWEWIVSLGLVAFYGLMGFGLLQALNEPVPAAAQAAFIGVLPIFLNQFLPAVGALFGVEISTATVSHTEFMIFGALIVWFLIVEPHGLAKLWSIAKQKLRLWPFRH